MNIDNSAHLSPGPAAKAGVCYNGTLRTWVLGDNPPRIILYETRDGQYAVPAYTLTRLELAALLTCIHEAITPDTPQTSNKLCN
jgi:hypothetical protein